MIEYKVGDQWYMKMLLKNADSFRIAKTAETTKRAEPEQKADEVKPLSPCKPSPGPGSDTNETPWQDGLQVGQPIEVYSKSACEWIKATVSMVINSDVVKVRYLIGRRWCEKDLRRTSKLIRPCLSTPDRPPEKPPSPEEKLSEALGKVEKVEKAETQTAWSSGRSLSAIAAAVISRRTWSTPKTRLASQKKKGR